MYKYTKRGINDQGGNKNEKHEKNDGICIKRSNGSRNDSICICSKIQRGSAGKTIGVQLQTSRNIEASEYEKDGAIVERYSKGSEAIQALKAGQIDCVIIDSQPAQKFVENNDDLKILEEPFVDEQYAICLAKDNEDLLKEMNEALKELKEDGTVDSIMDNYIGDDAGKTPYESPEDVEPFQGRACYGN